MIIRFDYLNKYFHSKYLDQFYTKISDSVKANLQREYYDYIIAEFDNQNNLNDEQLNCIKKWKNFFLIEQKSIIESKIILRRINEYLSNQNWKRSIPENVLFDLIFLLEKKRQHIDNLNRVILEYESKSIESYKNGLVVLEKLEREYDFKIKEAEKKANLRIIG